jgi:rhamnose transport system substrate-binding protein
MVSRTTTRRTSLILAGATALSIVGGAATSAFAAGKQYTIVVIPKLVGIPWFQAVKQGVDKASKELTDTRVMWQGPAVDQVDKQIQIIDSLIATHPDVIAVGSDDPVAIVPVLKKAQAAGIHVMSWDGDANYREAFVNIVDPDQMGASFVEEMVKQIGDKGDVAIITSNFAATNQVRWIEGIKKTIAAKYPGLNIVAILPSEEDQQLAFKAAQDIMKSYPTVKGIWAVTTVAFPGAAEAVKQAGKVGQIAVVGNTQPVHIRSYIKEGAVKSTVMFNPIDFGYLTVYAARQLAAEGLPADKPFKAGYLGEFTPVKDNVSVSITLGPPKVFDSKNIDSPEAQF